MPSIFLTKKTGRFFSSASISLLLVEFSIISFSPIVAKISFVICKSSKFHFSSIFRFFDK